MVVLSIELSGSGQEIGQGPAGGAGASAERRPNSWGEGWGDKGFGYLPYEFLTN